MGCCGSKNATIEENKIPQRKREEVSLKTTMEKKASTGKLTYLTPAEEPKEDKKWKRIPIPDTVKVNCHEHEIKKFTDTTQDDWMCNGINIYPKGCYSGITDFH